MTTRSIYRSYRFTTSTCIIIILMHMCIAVCFGVTFIIMPRLHMCTYAAGSVIHLISLCEEIIVKYTIRSLVEGFWLARLLHWKCGTSVLNTRQWTVTRAPYHQSTTPWFANWDQLLSDYTDITVCLWHIVIIIIFIFIIITIIPYLTSPSVTDFRHFCV